MTGFISYFVDWMYKIEIRILLKWLLTGITLFFCGSISHSFCQQGSLLFHHLKLEDGLSEVTNEYVFKDTRGFVWISSINGLNRFVGTRIRTYFPDQYNSTSVQG